MLAGFSRNSANVESGAGHRGVTGDELRNLNGSLAPASPMDSPYWSSCSRVWAGTHPGRWVGKGSPVGLQHPGMGRGGGINLLMVCLHQLS